MGCNWLCSDDAHGLCLLHLHVWLHHPCGHHSHLLCQDYQDHTVYGKHTRPAIYSKTVTITGKVTYQCLIAKLAVSSETRLVKTPKITCLFQNLRRTSNSSTWKSPGLQSRVKKDRKLTIMVAVMVIISLKKQISIPEFLDYFLPCDVVPLCLCLHS